MNIARRAIPGAKNARFFLQGSATQQKTYRSLFASDDADDFCEIREKDREKGRKRKKKREREQERKKKDRKTEERKREKEAAAKQSGGRMVSKSR